MKGLIDKRKTLLFTYFYIFITWFFSFLPQIALSFPFSFICRVGTTGRIKNWPLGLTAHWWMKKFIASQFNSNFSRKRKRDCCSWSKSRKMKVKRDWSLKYQMGRLNASMRNNNYRNIRNRNIHYVAWLTKQWLRKRLASMQIFFSFTVSKSNITKSPFNSWLFFVAGKKLISPILICAATQVVKPASFELASKVSVRKAFDKWLRGVFAARDAESSR